MTTSSIDPRLYRDVLGHYPTGVTVVTAIDSEGQPAGMAVGSFTSVSLDPPLIAFLPARSSSSFPRIRAATSFCVNVLSADQEGVCRTFAVSGGDKFAELAWHPAPSGAPVLEGVSAWIDCSFATVHEEGDHFIVIGAVTDLEVARSGPPLVFHRGGYGGFSPSSLVAAPEPDIIEQVRIAGLARTTMEALATEVGLECMATAVVDGQVVLLASADAPNPTYGRSRVGHRTPFTAPVGGAFIAWAEDSSQSSWLGARKSAAEPGIGASLARVRERGWSIALGDETYDELEAAISEVTRQGSDAALGRSVAAVVDALPAELFDPELDPNISYDLRLLNAPVFDASGRVALALGLRGFAAPVSGAEVVVVADSLVRAADALTVRVGGRPPSRPNPAA